MQCPACHATKDVVTDSRANGDQTVIRRRRECATCHVRFTTYEMIPDPVHGPEVWIERHARAKAIAAELREMARCLEVW